MVLPGLMLAMMLAMLDNMIVGTALPRIVGELGGLDAPVLGRHRLRPRHHRLHPASGASSATCTGARASSSPRSSSSSIGSALSRHGPDAWAQLIGFRALQGLGAGGLMVGAMAIIGDLVPPRERGQYQGMMAGVMALAMIGGPLVGGFITDHLGWRWAFYVNLPLGGVALAC